MKLIRQILFPFSAIYGAITMLRNLMYDYKIFKSTSFEIPIIAVGNLSVGGTGKSPQIEYLIRLLSDHKVATLSRGYKRKSNGFILADENSTAISIGDEPFQFHQKFPEVLVAVDANRTNGIEQVLKLSNSPQIVLLDDAFQHRKVKAGFYILLTTFADLYVDDFLLPTGNLRESRRGAKRADIVIVTKCPRDLPSIEQMKIARKLKLRSRQELYFSYIRYDNVAKSAAAEIDISIIKNTPKVLLCGIAKPKPFVDFLFSEGDLILNFPDHHAFNESEIDTILNRAEGRIIVTTEKDFVRLQGRLSDKQLYYVSIESAFLSNGEQFDKTVLNYVGKSTANRRIHQENK